MQVTYEGKEYTIEQITGDLYRVYNKGENLVITMSVAHRNGGTYHQINTIYSNGRCYSSWRYFPKYQPLAREAAFEVATHDGLYDYSDGKWYRLTRMSDGSMMWFVL